MSIIIHVLSLIQGCLLHIDNIDFFCLDCFSFHAFKYNSPISHHFFIQSSGTKQGETFQTFTFG